MFSIPLHLIVESVRPPYKYIVSFEHLPGHIYFNKLLFSPTGWGQVIGLCSNLVHIDLCFLLGCHGLCFHKATSVYIASIDRIYIYIYIYIYGQFAINSPKKITEKWKKKSFPNWINFCMWLGKVSQVMDLNGSRKQKSFTGRGGSRGGGG